MEDRIYYLMKNKCLHYSIWEVVPGVYHTMGFCFRRVKVCLRTKSRLFSLNRLWLCSPVELKVKNLGKSMSSYLAYPFRILNTCSMLALYLLNCSVGRLKVVCLMLYGSFRRSLDSLVALLWTPSTTCHGA